MTLINAELKLINLQPAGARFTSPARPLNDATHLFPSERIIPASKGLPCPSPCEQCSESDLTLGFTSNTSYSRNEEELSRARPRAMSASKKESGYLCRNDEEGEGSTKWGCSWCPVPRWRHVQGRTRNGRGPPQPQTTLTLVVQRACARASPLWLHL